jgi:hypothetical protein
MLPPRSVAWLTVGLALLFSACGNDESPRGPSGAGEPSGQAGRAGQGGTGGRGGSSTNGGRGGAGASAGASGASGTIAGTGATESTGGTTAGTGAAESTGGATAGTGPAAGSGGSDAGSGRGQGGNAENGEGGDVGEGGAGSPEFGGEAGGGGEGVVGAGGSSVGVGGTVGGTGTNSAGNAAGLSGSGGMGGSGNAGGAGTDGGGGNAGTAGGAGGSGADVCAGVTCSGHGTCAAAGSAASCVCDAGYAQPVGDPTVCGDIDECTTNNGGCDSLTTCTNLPGSNSCGACPAGYTGTGATGCVPIQCTGTLTSGCACVRVATGGNDALAAASGGTLPFQTLQTAIDFAAAHPAHATSVCVAQGGACGSTASYPGPAQADLSMRSGISVYGDYESTSWTRCSQAGTTLVPQSASGVVYDASVVLPTVLDGFTISRFVATTSTGVTITGAHGVVLTNVTIAGGAGSTNLVGVDASGGADAKLLISMPGTDPSGPQTSLGGTLQGQPVLVAGASALGVRAVGATVDVQATMALTSPTTSNGVWLSNSPGSSVHDSTVQVFSLTTDGFVSFGTATAVTVQNGGSTAVARSQVRAGDSLAEPGVAHGLDVTDTSGISLSATDVQVYATNEAIGIKALNSAVTYSGSTNASGYAGPAYAVWLENAAGSTLSAFLNAASSLGTAEGIHWLGSAQGVALGSGTIDARGIQATGISLEICAEDAPAVDGWTVSVSSTNPQTVTGVSADLSCPALINANNVTVTSATLAVTQSVTGIACGDVCEITNDVVNFGSPSSIGPPHSNVNVTFTGINCSGCCELSGNQVNGLDAIQQDASQNALIHFQGVAVANGTGCQSGS